MSKKITSIFLATILLVSNVTLVSCATADKKAAQTSNFGLIKQLAGSWKGSETGGDEKMKDVYTVFSVTSGGTAVAEKMFPGTEHEMMNLYNQDGESVVATHYCMMGNQPRMKTNTRNGNSLNFEYVDATNLPNANAKHMHSLKITLLDANHLREEWTHFDGGKQQGAAVFDFTRVQ